MSGLEGQSTWRPAALALGDCGGHPESAVVEAVSFGEATRTGEPADGAREKGPPAVGLLGDGELGKGTLVAGTPVAGTPVDGAPVEGAGGQGCGTALGDGAELDAEQLA